MVTAAKWVISVVVGGITLGTLFGQAVNPRIKDPPLQWWQLTARSTIAASDQVLEDVGPDDLNPYSGYRPDLDYDTEVWALAIPGTDIVRYPDYLPSAPPQGPAAAPAELSAVDQQAELGPQAESPVPSDATPEAAPDDARTVEVAATDID